MGRLAEAWIASPEVRELRELTRYRHKLVHLRTSCKDQVHAVLAKLGVPVTCSDIFGVAGSAWLDQLGLPQPYAGKITSLPQLTAELTTEITMLSEVEWCRGTRGSRPGGTRGWALSRLAVRRVRRPRAWPARRGRIAGAVPACAPRGRSAAR